MKNRNNTHPKLPQLSYASVYKRLAASLLDRSLFVLIPLLAFWVVAIILTQMGHSLEGFLRWSQNVPGFWILFAGWMLYCVGMESVKGATWGKKIMGCKVVDERNVKVGPVRAFRRFWTSAFNWIPLGLGFWFILSRKDRRGFHDMIAGTYVVDADPAQRNLPIAGKIVLGFFVLFVVSFITFVFLIRSSQGSYS